MVEGMQMRLAQIGAIRQGLQIFAKFYFFARPYFFTDSHLFLKTWLGIFVLHAIITTPTFAKSIQDSQINPYTKSHAQSPKDSQPPTFMDLLNSTNTKSSAPTKDSQKQELFYQIQQKFHAFMGVGGSDFFSAV